ncbi:hypothetical protein SDC9_149063 [bioreactor metagenome]|uniref:Uncharacterized protein n=1 Tax=bioreactor metagenome TaxID=1076179 RepID=A0A645EIS4_9ZZZZ
MHKEDGAWCQVVHDSRADLSCCQCAAPVTGIDCPANGVHVAHTGCGGKDCIICRAHRCPEVRTGSSSACAVLHQCFHGIQFPDDFIHGHCGGIIVGVGVVADFMTLLNDFVDHCGIGQTVQEESGFHIHGCQVRQNFADIIGVRRIADGQGDGFFAGGNLVNDF